MPRPSEITDALESVVSIYFSDVRHKLRAAFILTDELVEMACTKQVQSNLSHITFVPLLRHAAVGLNPVIDAHNPVVIPLGVTLHSNHLTRNQLQHVNPALLVDDQHCADFILDAVETIEHCFPGSQLAFQFALRISLRVVRLIRRRTTFGSGTSSRTRCVTIDGTAPKGGRPLKNLQYPWARAAIGVS